MRGSSQPAKDMWLLMNSGLHFGKMMGMRRSDMKNQKREKEQFAYMYGKDMLLSKSLCAPSFDLNGLVLGLTAKRARGVQGSGSTRPDEI